MRPRQRQNLLSEPCGGTVLDGDGQQPQPLQECGLRGRVHSAAALGGAQDVGDLERPQRGHDGVNRFQGLENSHGEWCGLAFKGPTQGH